MGEEDPAGAPDLIRAQMARRRMPCRARGLGTSHFSQRQERAQWTTHHAVKVDADKRHAAPDAGDYGRQLSSIPSRTAKRDRREVADFIREHGASFFEEIVEGTHLLRVQAEELLSELVALGVVSSDSFAGLRALLRPESERKRRFARRRGSCLDGAGRWALALPNRRKQSPSASRHADDIEHIAWALLRRYGVVFLRMLERKFGLAAEMAGPAKGVSQARSARRHPRRQVRRRLFW